MIRWRITLNACNLARSGGRYRRYCTKPSHGELHPLVPYTLPEWATRLAASSVLVPERRYSIANLNTPIQRWKLHDVPDEYEISIKRDDLTGSTLSGNKIRKLDFLLADATHRGCKHVITCGAEHSNHCRATAIAARHLGLQPHLVLRSHATSPAQMSTSGNMLYTRMCGAKIYVAPWYSPFSTHIKPRMEQIAHTLQKTTGEKAYQICVGGSNLIGFFGYLDAFNEMINQGVTENFTDIVFASGSGGTAAGLAVANYLSGSKLRIHAMGVSDDIKYFYKHLTDTLLAFGIDEVRGGDILNVVMDYKGDGYTKSSSADIEFIIKVAVETGIMLDPTYTGKAARGLVEETKKSPSIFKGNKILFLHTGGLFDAFEGKLGKFLMENGSIDDITMWPDTLGQ